MYNSQIGEIIVDAAPKHQFFKTKFQFNSVR